MMGIVCFCHRRPHDSLHLPLSFIEGLAVMIRRRICDSLRQWRQRCTPIPICYCRWFTTESIASPTAPPTAAGPRFSSATAVPTPTAARFPTTPTLRPVVPYPARQNPFSSLLSSEEDNVLLAKSPYCILTLYHYAETNSYALYCATSNEVIVMQEDQLWKGSMWLDERVGEDYIAALLFPADAAATLKKACVTVIDKARKRVVEGPDTWGIVYMAFRAQQEVVRGVDIPASLEEASFVLSQKQFDTGILEPPTFDVASGTYLSAVDVKKPGAARGALLTWNALVNVHRRFGTPGSRKSLNPIDQIVRRAVKAVNVFVISIDVRVGRGTIADGYTMVVTIFDAQKRSQTVFMIRSLAEETAKLNALTTLLYGEGSSSISLFVPTLSTKTSQLVAFARTCRPKSPFFVTETSSLGPYFGGRNLGLGLTPEADPRTTWSILRDNLFTEKHLRKEEEKMDRYLQRGFTALANKLFSDRLQKVSPAIMSAASSIPAQEPESSALVRVSKMEEEARSNPVPSVAASTFVNKVNVNDAEVVFGLQQWRSKIYEDQGRLERETKTLDSLRRYLILDLETTTIRRYKRIANPFTKENYIVLSGARDYKGNVFMPKRYFDRGVALRYDDPGVTSSNYLVEKSSELSLFLPSLNDYDVIVGHNIKFDLLQIWRDAELKKFLKRGGKIWDTMYAEYLLTGQEVKLGRGAGLEDVARSYGGQTPKLDAVKRAWAEGKETYEIPYPTLTEYLHGDLENTELIFRKHMERALHQRQVIICSARMDGLLCTTEMEYNGLKTNVELAASQSNELMTKVHGLRQDLLESIPVEIPPDCRKFFNWSSNQHLITLFFGGKLKLSTNARESRILTGEAFDRHSLFIPSEVYTKELYPDGVFLRPPVNSVGPSDCGIIAGVATEKGTRIFKAYYENYMRQANFRKSSTLMDSLKREMTAIPRAHPEKRGETSALANLLPRRHLFLFAAVSTNTSDNRIAKLFVKNPITGESVTLTDSDKTTALRQFIASQVEKHTDTIVASDEETQENSNFLDAQVTIVARDAAFSFQQSIHTDSALTAYLEEHSGYTQHTKEQERYTITLADAVSILSFYRYQYCDEPQPKGRAASFETKIPIFPAKALPPPTRKKTSTASLFLKMLRLEVQMKPEEWCHHYADVFLHMGNATLQREALEPLKARRRKKNEAVLTDDALPVLLRQRRVLVGYYNSLPEAERKRLSLMSLVGRTIATPWDCFATPCTHGDVVEVNVKGRLATYVPNELEAEQIMRRFRSAATRQLQVGEDTLSYFKTTHNDKAASTILELRGLEKLIGTYYESTDGGTGMVSLVHAHDRCIHHELIHNKTNTGRLASANPNCQNIPKEDKSALRDMFISRYGEKGMCIEADYSQLEVVALAVLAEDEQMLDDLRHNVDFHCKRVAMMRPDLNYKDVLLRAKKNKEPDFVRLRQQAKIFSFQRQYGAGVKMISQSTGLTQDQVRMLIEKERETYRGVDVFNNMVTLSANSYDASIQDGARNVKGHQFFKGMFPVLTGSRYVFTESDIPEDMQRSNSSTKKSTNFSPTHLKNYPVQGFAGEIVQVMLGVLWRRFYASENYSNLAVLTNTVHDCVWVDCHESVYHQVAKDVEITMGSVREVLNGLFPEMNISVDFPCDVVAGEHMGSLRPIIEETTL